MTLLTTLQVWAYDVNLSTLTDNLTVYNGAILSGSTSYTITIADNASITLSDATINGGIICAGTATITLVGTNNVRGLDGHWDAFFKIGCTAGIQVGGTGTTLTIGGTGALTVTGGNNCPGIGLSSARNTEVYGGDIVIEGGTIHAIGGEAWGPGIGTGQIYEGKLILGNISIKGGSVTASINHEYIGGESIGVGDTYNNCVNEIGEIMIYVGITKVELEVFKGSFIYKYGDTELTTDAQKAEHFNISKALNQEYYNHDYDGYYDYIITAKDDTDYNISIDDGISHGKVSAASKAKFGEYVLIDAIPHSGYGVESLTVKDSHNNIIPVTKRRFVMPKDDVTISATFKSTTASFNELTGVLTLSGNVNADEVKAFGKLNYNNYDSPITSVVCEPGTVLPKDCRDLFYGYNNVKVIDFFNADTSLVTDTPGMFGLCEKLTTIYVNSNWNLGKVTDSYGMFSGCFVLKGGIGWTYDSDYEDETYACIDTDDQHGYLTGFFTLTLPDYMEIVTDSPEKRGDLYPSKATIIIKATKDYLHIPQIKANGTYPEPDAQGHFVVTMGGANMVVEAMPRAIDKETDTSYHLVAHKGKLYGQWKYVATFCDYDQSYQLPAGAQAFFMKSDFSLYRVGADGSIIPQNTAVIIIADEEALSDKDYNVITMTKVGNPGFTVSGNALSGTDSSTHETPTSAEAYVLSADSDNNIGFYIYYDHFNGFVIPPHKAYILIYH